MITGAVYHPAWGWQHSERNYRIAVQLAEGDGLRVDTDVLFAAAFLRDIPRRLVRRTAQRMGAERAVELGRFLDALQSETFDGRAM